MAKKKKKLLDRIKDQIAQEGLAARSRKSRDWLKAMVKNISMPGAAKYAFVNLPKTSLDISQFANKIKYGYVRLFFFFYDPKTKEKLPYYDTFPLIIPIAYYPNGFLGLNLHYIHPNHRLQLLDRLEDILTNDKYDETTKFMISYQVIKHNSRYYMARPCIKRYLFSHVRSKFLELNADDWDTCVLLPFEEFQKASSSKVWGDSIKKYSAWRR